MSLLLDSSLGLGQIQRAMLRTLFVGVNSTLDEIDAALAADDVEFETFMGRDNPQPTASEHVASKNFYEGHRPSLINAPIGNYPNVSCWTVRAVPAGESSLSDHTDIFNDLLFVEVMAKAAPGEDEEVVNRRTSRLAEAVHLVVARDKSLGGVVTGLDTPSVNLSDVFLRRERGSSGPQWSWQGARLEYAVRKDAVLPSSTPGSVFRAARVPSVFEGMDIDQM